MDFITFCVIYYLIGVVVIFVDWTRTCDFTVGVLLMTLLVLWVLWPVVFLTLIFNVLLDGAFNKVLIKKWDK